MTDGNPLRVLPVLHPGQAAAVVLQIDVQSGVVFNIIVGCGRDAGEGGLADCKGNFLRKGDGVQLPAARKGVVPDAVYGSDGYGFQIRQIREGIFTDSDVAADYDLANVLAVNAPGGVAQSRAELVNHWRTLNGQAPANQFPGSLIAPFAADYTADRTFVVFVEPVSGGDDGLSFQNLSADGALFAVRQAVRGTGGSLAGDGFLSVAGGGDFFLGDQHRAADGALNALGESGLGAGGSLAGGGFLSVAGGGDFFLGDQHRAADRAMTALRQTRFGAGGSLGFINDFRMGCSVGTSLCPGDKASVAVPDFLRPGGVPMGVISCYRVVENIVCSGEAIPQELHRGQTGAARESVFSDVGDTIGNGDRGQTGAVPESTVSDGGDTIGNGDRGQTGAVIESEASDGGDPFGNRNGGQAGATLESAAFDGGDLTGNVNRGQTGAAMESPDSDGSDPLGNGDRGQAGAAIEIVVSDGSDTIGNGDRGQTGAAFESGAFDGGDPIRNGDRGQTGAVIESAASDGGNPIRNGDRG